MPSPPPSAPKRTKVILQHDPPAPHKPTSPHRLELRAQAKIYFATHMCTITELAGMEMFRHIPHRTLEGWALADGWAALRETTMRDVEATALRKLGGELASQWVKDLSTLGRFQNELVTSLEGEDFTMMQAKDRFNILLKIIETKNEMTAGLAKHLVVPQTGGAGDVTVDVESKGVQPSNPLTDEESFAAAHAILRVRLKQLPAGEDADTPAAEDAEEDADG